MNPQIRTFEAETTAAALALVKRELGPEAMILGTRVRERQGIPGLRRPRIEVTAAPPEAVAPDKAASATGQPTNALSRSCYEKLLAADVAEHLARRIVAGTGLLDPGGTSDRGQVRQRFCAAIERMAPVAGGIQLARGGTRVALLGPAGAGKTTAIAKLAAQFHLRQKQRVALISLDTHGVGRHEQLARYAELIGLELFMPRTAQACAELRQQLADRELVLIDTGGLAPGDADQFDSLAAMLNVLAPHERHLVLPASMAAGVQSRMGELFAPLAPNRLLLTRLDEAIGMGVLLSAADRLSLQVSYTSAGQRVPSDLEEACSVQLANSLWTARERFSDPSGPLPQGPEKADRRTAAAITDA